MRLRPLILAIALVAPAVVASPQIDRLARWLHSPRDDIRLEAVQELARAPRSDAMPLLVSALTDSNAEVRATAAWSLSNARDDQVVAALRPLLRDDDDRVRASAAWSLSHIGGKSVLPDIVPLCHDDASGVVRFRAVWGLAFIGDSSALPVAINALGDANNSVRERAALLALEQLSDKTVTERLVAQSTNSFAPTRRIVMYLFARYPGEAALPALRTGLADPEPLVRGEAALSLGKLRAQSEQAQLRLLLKDADDHVRGAAAYALGLIGDKDALRSVLQDDAAFVRAIAAESLNRLGDNSVKPPEGFRAAEMFTYPIYSPERGELYR